MGLIWDLIQHNQISDAHGKADSLEHRMTVLENQLQRTNETLVRLLRALESRFGDDLDGDGRVG
jgi:chaperonin cofactor prefoldin